MSSERVAEFAAMLKKLRDDSGLSLRQLADRAHYRKSYLHELEHGDKPPTPQVADVLDEALDAGGRLAALAPAAPQDPPPPVTAPVVADLAPMDDQDIDRLRSTIEHLVALDTLHGSEGLASNALRAFRNAQRRLAVAGADPGIRADLQASLAELGEVAAWLAFDSEQHDLSRQVAAEAILIAQAAGDTSMVRFLMSHLSMQAVYLDRPAEALDLAGRVLADDPRSKRVVGMMRVRRAQALAKLRDADEALRELQLARRDLEDGVGPDDPQWTWWWHAAELARHESHMRLAASDTRGAVAASEHAVLYLPPGQGRDQALFRADLLADLVEVRAWSDVDRVAEELVQVAPGVGSARVPRIVRRAERRVVRAGAPAWVVDAMREAADAADPSA